MTAPQPPHAPVLRRHRLAAYIADRAIEAPPPGSPAERWVVTGKGDCPLWQHVAQLAADCEARGEPGALHRAWESGYESGYDDRSKMDFDRADVIKTQNPYPELVRPLPAEGERT